MATRDVLDVFEQVCAAVAHMHGRQLAHRDVKPHNVLVVRPEHNVARGGTSVFEDEDGDGSASGDDGLADADAAERGEPPSAGTAQPQPQQQQQQRAPKRRRRRRYGAVLMDFGSARAAVVAVTNRADALALQEDAEAHCTATYRAPELFDVGTYSTLDARVDVWSLGCTLYHMLYGASPFQEALDRGASLPLAVMNCRIPWPKPPAPRYPQELHDLVSSCLTPDPAARPTSDQLLARVRGLRRRPLPDAAPQPAAAARR
ncbi:MAG: kinase-like domain-containing protein [Monoraphidium minutum]|nr:MAG: kinase-like domain-containing protein [Monoraphidium minutum]